MHFRPLFSSFFAKYFAKDLLRELARRGKKNRFCLGKITISFSTVIKVRGYEALTGGMFSERYIKVSNVYRTEG